jgi:hypothetical protein
MALGPDEFAASRVASLHNTDDFKIFLYKGLCKYWYGGGGEAVATSGPKKFSIFRALLLPVALKMDLPASISLYVPRPYKQQVHL